MTKIRLQKFLSQSGIASRRKSEEFIKEGRVKLNNDTVTAMGVLIDPEIDQVKVDDKEVQKKENQVYYMLNKPPGYVSTCLDPFADKTVLTLIPKQTPVFPVGRLDKNSRGLIILTNDGNLANNLTHPKFEHEKEYEVEAIGQAQPIETIQKLLKKLSSGVKIDDKITNPANIKLQFVAGKKIKFNIILKEGKKRQIRKMAESIGYRVIDLKRIRIGKLILGTLPEGKYKKIDYNDIL